MLHNLPPLALGGNVFGWTADETDSFRILDRFVEAGGVMIDTADVYSNWAPGNVGGESEAIIGRWLKANPHKRERVVVATKAGFEGGLAPEHVAKACDASLARLGTTIDLYYQHKDDATVPLSDSLGAFDALVRAGKVRAVGLSNFEADRIRDALSTCAANGLTRPVALQNWYNLVERERYEVALQPLAVAEGLAQFPYYGLASGFLTGKYRRAGDGAGAPRAGRAEAYLDRPAGPLVLAALDSIAAETGEPHAAVALAWLKSRPSVVAPIASASRPEQIGALLRSLTLELTAAQRAQLDAASAASAAGACAASNSA